MSFLVLAVSSFAGPPSDAKLFAEDLYRCASRLLVAVAGLPQVSAETTPDELGLIVDDEEWSRVYEAAASLPLDRSPAMAQLG